MIKDLFTDKIPSLFLFDMDHTLINNDCDVSWKTFLVKQGAAPESSLGEAERFYDDYVRGELNITEFLRFQFKEFIGRSKEEMNELARIHFDEVVKSKIHPYFIELLQELHEENIPRAIVTATNEIVAQPLADFLRIPTVLATKLELIDEKYTGEMSGEYCYSNQKVTAAEKLASRLSVSLNETSYFGDSLSDVPLLRKVKYPFLINPGDSVTNCFKNQEINIIHL